MRLCADTGGVFVHHRWYPGDHGYSMDIYPSTNTPGLWMVGGFTFNLSATVVDQTATFLNITGTGIIRADGFDDTVATWAFTVQNAGGNQDFFSFSANSATGVPDGGSAVALLGMGLGMIEFIRRRVRLRA